MEELSGPAGERLCIRCLGELSAESRFCKHCGSSQLNGEPDITDAKWSRLQQAGLFYAIELAICLLYGFGTSFQNLLALSLFHAVSAINAILFFLYAGNAYRRVLSPANLRFRKAMLYAGAAAAGSIVVSYSCNRLNVYLFSGDMSYYSFFAGYPGGKWLMVFYIAVLPAAFEELAYRGYLLQALTRIVDEKQAILLSSFLFSIIHLSFLSLYWLLPFSFALGYLAVKERTIWYGVIIHFVFNLVSCLYELYGIGELASDAPIYF
jgi:uncharacterized protein